MNTIDLSKLMLCLLAVVGLFLSPGFVHAGPIWKTQDSDGQSQADVVETMEQEIVNGSFSTNDRDLKENANLSDKELSYLMGNTKAQKKAGVALPTVALVTGIAVAGAVVADQASNSPIF